MIKGDVLKEARKKKGLSQDELAKLIGVSRVAITNYENSTNSPTFENTKKICEILNIPEQDLFDPSKREQIAREEVRKAPALYAQEFPEIQRMEGMVSLPFITIGAGAEAVANVALAESIFLPREILPTNFDPQHTLVGKILGDSMEPKFHENDIVVFDMVDGRDVVFPDAVYLVRYGDTIQIKQVQFLGNGDIRIISFNDTYPPVQPRRDLGVDWEIVGKPFIHLEAHISSRLQEAK